MPQVGQRTLEEVEAALGRYKHLVESSALSDSAKVTYYSHVNDFVRWLKDEFVPGAHVAERTRRT